MNKKEKSRKYLQPGAMIIVSILIATVMIVFAFIEISNSKKRTRILIFQKGLALIELVEKSTALAIRANDKIEEEISRRLLSTTRTVALLDGRNNIDQETLASIADRHEVLTLHLIDKFGRIEMSNRKQDHLSKGAPRNFEDIFPELFSGTEVETVLGIHSSRSGKEKRFSVAVRREGGGIVLASIEADALTELRRSFGFGRMIQDVGKVYGVSHIVLQDQQGIISASKDIEQIDSIKGDAFLSSAWNDGKPLSRLKSLPGGMVFEVVKKIRLDQDFSGLLRIAFDGHEIMELENKARRRMIITFVGLALLLAAAVNALIIYQNMALVRRTRDEVATFSGAILKGMADAVFVIASDGSVKMTNDRAGLLFGNTRKSLPSELTDVIEKVFRTNGPIIEDITIIAGNGNDREVVVGGSKVVIEKDMPYAVLICRDETETRQMEKQMQRNEKITAMGELAGAVAHEIRNPLNAIGLTVQRLGIEFAPSADVEEYQNLLHIVSEEINRLDDIIGQFLQFARAPVVERRPEDITDLVSSVVAQIQGLAQSRSISIKVDAPHDLSAYFDAKQIRQVMLNLLTNAIDACDEGGMVSVTIQNMGEQSIIVTVKDNGAGMNEEEQKKVFDLYFSTKEKGTGLGLPIALRIVQAHNGTLTVNSTPGSGTSVTVALPQKE